MVVTCKRLHFRVVSVNLFGYRLAVSVVLVEMTPVLV